MPEVLYLAVALSLSNRRTIQKIFLMVPLVLCLPYMPILVASRSTYQMRLLVVLSITSLLCTAYTLKYIPLPKKDRKGKRPVRAHVGLFDEHGPLRRYLGWLNGAIGALLCLAAWSRRGNDAAGDDGWWVLWLVPGGKVDSQWCSRFGNGQ